MDKKISLIVGITIIFVVVGIQPAFAISNNGNNPPYAPIIDGPSSAEPSNECYFTFNSTDPDDDYVIYQIDWGDGTYNQWIGPYVSGEEVIKSHRWFICKAYAIRAKAKNVYGMESNWSEFQITIPRTRAASFLCYEWLLERFPMLERLLNIIF